MTLHWPQIVLVGLIFLGLGMNLAKDGEPRVSNYSFFWSLVASGVELWLLWAGGFFSMIGGV